ncbi:hypothetical protein RIF29_15692 [Crotalaria pallida]|uniref:Uncharacterized protein n=1 Tax=Crotalaria pallida TaxID=3830 RepID=A0AAN9FFY1_CROPI
MNNISLKLKIGMQSQINALREEELNENFFKALSYVQEIHANCKVLLRTHHQEKESWDLNTQEKIEAAGKKKEEGNVLFKAGKYARASKRYEQDEKKQAKALKVACNLNNAASKLKLKEHKEAEKLCTKVLCCLPSFKNHQSSISLKIMIFDVDWHVLDLESTNVKALYRRAQAYIHLADLDLAEFDIKKALEIDPDNRFKPTWIGCNNDQLITYLGRTIRGSIS